MTKSLRYALKMQCIGIRLNTWSFQAKEFYESLGYEVYAKLENYLLNSTLYSMKRIIISDDYPQP